MSIEEKIDKLNRTEFVHFIENLILNSDQYKRDNDSNSYVIALDSAWGTGKTYFLSLLNQELTNSEDIYLINYNAWKNDYCDNAFNPLLYDILNSECLKFDIDPIADKENTKNFILSLLRVGAAFGKQVAKNKLGIDIGEALEAAEITTTDIKNLALSQIPELEELYMQRNAFDKFKIYLEAATNSIREKGGKLVIVIDELDRCKPTFAIQTLEIVKHIFDVNNMVFLFAIDIKQLSYSISSVYGQGFDSTGYLCRFFDYIAKMPAPDIKPYIEERLKEIENIPDSKDFSYKKKDYDFCVNILADFFYDIYVAFDFSLRDLDTVIQSYKIMLNSFLKEYDMIGAHLIYVFCVALKYKKPRLFEETFIGTFNRENFKEMEQTISKHFNECLPIKAMLSQLINGKILQYINTYPFCDSEGQSSGRTCRIDKVIGGTAYFADAMEVFGMKYTTYTVKDFVATSMGNILFYPDIIRWEEIKHRTLREHIHKQLEMFNFVEETVEKE